MTAPIPSGPIGRIMQRVLALRDLSPTPEVLVAARALEEMERAEQAEREGIRGELLDRVIVYLEGNTSHVDGVREAVYRVADLQPATADGGYV